MTELITRLSDRAFHEFSRIDRDFRVPDPGFVWGTNTQKAGNRNVDSMHTECTAEPYDRLENS